jgi:hypothetical protein
MARGTEDFLCAMKGQQSALVASLDARKVHLPERRHAVAERILDELRHRGDEFRANPVGLSESAREIIERQNAR